MKSIKAPVSPENKHTYKLNSAIIKDYEYTKTYYKMENGIPLRSEKGDDSSLTIVNIRKRDAIGKSKRTFIFSEGYIGAEKSYNNDGTKKNSIARKDGFGISYMIKYIENAKENKMDNFHVMFLSNEETSENQAELFAQAIKDLTTNDVEKTYMWCHSKSGLLALRAFQKLKDSKDIESEKVLGKIKAVITSMPTKGIDSVNRDKMIKKLNDNKALNFLPFSGFIKTGLLAWYDKYLYKPTPAQVDLKKPETEKQLLPIKEKTKLNTFFDKIWGNDRFQKRVQNAKEVKYDPGYLGRTTSDENLDKIKDVDYKVLPVNIEIKDALEGLVKHGQIMPFILYAKKALTKQNGDGIITYSEQGMNDIKAKYKVDTVVKAGHDMPTMPEALKTVKKELLQEDDELDK